MKRDASSSEPTIAFRAERLPDTRHVIPRDAHQGVPEIDGSQGAFIGLVVALSVIIVVCCAAVFYLLRHHEPTDQERAARRERYRRTREQTLNSNTTFTEPTPSSGLGALGSKVKRLWQTGNPERGRRGGRGWIRAGDDDAWAPHPGPPPAGADPERGGAASLPVPGRDSDARANVDGARVVVSPSSDTTHDFAGSPYAYADPFSKTTMVTTTSESQAVLERSQSPATVSSPASSPRGSASADESQEGHAPRNDPRHRSAMSNVSVWTHGSKFVEDI